MNMEQFRTNEELVLEAKKTFERKFFKLLLDTMDEEHPMNYVETRPQSDFDNSKKLGIIYGWNLFRTTLLSAAELKQPALEPEATFEG